MSNRDARPLPVKPLSALHDAAIEEIHEGHERWGIPVLLDLHTGLRRRLITHFTDDWIVETQDGLEIQTPKEAKCRIEEGGCYECNRADSGGPDGYYRPKTGQGEQRAIPIFDTWYDYHLEESRDTELPKWIDHWFNANDVGWKYNPVHFEHVVKRVAFRRCETIADGHQGKEVIENLPIDEPVPDIIPHDLRATWATQCLRNGVDDTTLMDWAGWKESDMVDHYRSFIGDPGGTERVKYENGPDNDTDDNNENTSDVDMSEVVEVYSKISDNKQINPADHDEAVLEAAYEMVRAS